MACRRPEEACQFSDELINISRRRSPYVAVALRGCPAEPSPHSRRATQPHFASFSSSRAHAPARGGLRISDVRKVFFLPGWCPFTVLAPVVILVKYSRVSSGSCVLLLCVTQTAWFIHTAGAALTSLPGGPIGGVRGGNFCGSRSQVSGKNDKEVMTINTVPLL